MTTDPAVRAALARLVRAYDEIEGDRPGLTGLGLAVEDARHALAASAERHPEDRPGGQVYPATRPAGAPLASGPPTAADLAWVNEVGVPAPDVRAALARLVAWWDAESFAGPDTVEGRAAWEDVRRALAVPEVASTAVGGFQVGDQVRWTAWDEGGWRGPASADDWSTPETGFVQSIDLPQVTVDCDTGPRLLTMPVSVLRHASEPPARPDALAVLRELLAADRYGVRLPDVIAERARAVLAAADAPAPSGQGGAKPAGNLDGDAPEVRQSARLAEIEALEEGWDSYGARPLQPGVRGRAENILALLRNPSPLISPTTDGGLMLEWRDAVNDQGVESVEIEVMPAEGIAAFIDGEELTPEVAFTAPAPTEPQDVRPEPVAPRPNRGTNA